MDLAARAVQERNPGVALVLLQEPQHAAGLYPENDLSIQLTKLENNLRHMMGEDLITHLGTEYYDEG